MRRKRKHPQHEGMSPFTAGLIAIVVIAAGRPSSASRSPTRSPTRTSSRRSFQNANNLKPNSPVRIAGVEVGKVKKVERDRRRPAPRTVTMEIKDKGLPIHEDATLKVRPRIFLEGNFFVDIQPGSPSVAGPARSGDDPIPIEPDRRAGPVRRRARRAPDRHARGPAGLPQGVLARAWRARAREGFNQSLRRRRRTPSRTGDRQRRHARRWSPPRTSSALLKGQQKTFAALVERRGGAQGPRHQLQRHRRRASRARTWRSRRRSRRCATPCSVGLAGARRRSTPRCPRCARSPSTRCRACAPPDPTLRGGAAVHPPGPRCSSARASCGGAARELRAQLPRPRAAQREPACRSSSEARRCPRAPATCSCRSPRRRSPTPTSRATTTSRSTARSTAASWASRARAASPTATSPTSTPARQRLNLGAAECHVARRRRPTAAGQPPARRPDVPCETQEPPNLNAPGGSLASFTAARPRRAAERRSPNREQGRRQEDLKAAAPRWRSTTRRQEEAASCASTRSSSGSRSWRRRPSEARDPQAPRRLPRDPRAVRPRRSAIGGYILSNQRLRFPLIQEKPFTVKVELPDAQAVQPGQGQTVRTAGVEIGQIGKVELEDGKAVVELQLENEVRGLHQARTPRRCCAPRPASRTCSSRSTRARASRSRRTAASPSTNTAPDIDPDEVLVGARHRHARLPEAADLRRRQGPQGPRLRTCRRPSPRLGPLNRDLGRRHHGRRAPAQEPLEPRQQLRPAHEGARHQGPARSCGSCGVERTSSRRSPRRTRRSRTP